MRSECAFWILGGLRLVCSASAYGKSVPFGYWVVLARTLAVTAVLGVSLNQEGI